MPEATLHIGVAKSDITPTAGVTLVGYRPRTSTAIGHRLRAEALVCKPADGAGGWAMVTSDVIGYQREFVQQVRAAAAERTGLAPEAILVSGTHTHSGPPTILFGSEDMAEVDRTNLDALRDKLIDLIVAADADAQPGVFEAARTEAAELGSNRRIQKDDGSWANEWEDPEGHHPGFFDPTVLLVAVRRPDGSRPALVVNYGVHPVVLGPQSLDVSADYPGYLKDRLEAAGVADTVLFALAGGGNVNPRTCIQVGAEHPERMGQALAEIVAHATTGLKPVGGASPVACQELWRLVRTRDAMKRKHRPGSKTGETIESEIQAFRAGDLAVVSLPGELFSEYNRMLRDASPAPQTLVVSLANDYIGYLPTDEAQKQGAYETNMAPADPLEEALMATARSAFAGIA